MALFKIHNSAVKKLVARDLDLERNLQELFEANLEEILNIAFLAHEYSTNWGGRIDTLGIDKNGSPCIIEYKKNQNDNVINQGLSYLLWLLDLKADFEVLCQNKNIDIKIEWDSPRVICITENYNKFDVDTADILANFGIVKLELYRYRIHDDNILYLELENYQKIRISASGIVKKSKQGKEETKRLQKTYLVDDHLAGIDKQTIVLFQTLREKILSLDESIIEEAKAKYIAYKTSTNFADIAFNKHEMKIYINVKSERLYDPQKLANDLTK